MGNAGLEVGGESDFLKGRFQIKLFQSIRDPFFSCLEFFQQPNAQDSGEGEIGRFTSLGTEPLIDPTWGIGALTAWHLTKTASHIPYKDFICQKRVYSF
jgi:hypothetical protein